MQLFFLDLFRTLHVSLKREKIVFKTIEPYLLGHKSKYSIYNIWFFFNTLQKILRFAENITNARKVTLVNTIKKSYQPFEKSEGKRTKNGLELKKMAFTFSVTKWIGGTLTNFKVTYQRYLFYKYLGKLELPKGSKYIKMYSNLVSTNIPTLAHFLVSLGENHWAINEAKLLGIKVAQSSENDFRTSLADFNLYYRQNRTTFNLLMNFLNDTICQARLYERSFFFKDFLKFLKRKASNTRRVTRILNIISQTIHYYNKIY